MRPYLLTMSSYLKLFVTLLVLLAGTNQFPSFAQENRNVPGKSQYTISNTDYFKDTIEIKALIDLSISIESRMPDSTIVLLKRGLAGSILLHYQSGIAKSLSHLTTLYFNQGKYNESYRLLQQMLVIGKKTPFKSIVPLVCNNLGNYFVRQGQYDSASFYYYKAIALVERDPNNKLSLAFLYTNMSTVLINLAAYEKALHYLNKAEVKAREKKDYRLLTTVLINKGSTYSIQEKWEDSRNNIQEALQLARKEHLLEQEQLALTNLGSIFFLQKKYGEAVPYLREALDLKGNIDSLYRNSAVTMLGKVYFAMKDYSLAERYMQDALVIAERLNIPKDIRENNEMLSKLYAETGNYKKAFEHQYAFIQIKDSLENINIKQSINQLEIKYSTAEKNKKIAENQLKINRQGMLIRQKNSWIIGISLGALLLALTGVQFFNLYRINRHKQRLQAEKLLNLEQLNVIDHLKAMMKGEENERARLARELHDGVGSMLASVKLGLAVVKKDPQDDVHQNWIT
jgi:tetratricopeptide (TPR) repeat protein